MSRVQRIGPALLLCAMVGCAHVYEQSLGYAPWSTVTSRAEVFFHDGMADEGIIRIPATVELKPESGDSLHVLDFDALYEEGVIKVTGRLRLPDPERPPRHDLAVRTDGTHPTEIPIVYMNPDGGTELIQTIVVH